MTGSRRDMGSDLAKVDAHQLGDADYEEVPELGDDWFARAQPYKAGRPRGRPKSSDPKQVVNLRLSRRVVDGFRSGGPGWQTRINAALEQWLDSQPTKG